MKHLLTILTFWAWGYTTLAADTTIVFRKVNYADVFALAKKEHKGVMLYFHFDGCGACVTMERTAFKDPKVIDYYNANFINFEINTLKGEGIDINKIYQVKLHPTYMFFDNEGKELHKIVGVYSPEAFYKQAHNALLSDKNLSNYKRLYHSGNREPGFLFDYTYMLRDANELDSVVINEYLNTQPASELSTEKNIRFIYEFMIHRGKTCIAVNNPAYAYMLSHKEQFAQFFELEQINTRLMFVVQSVVYDAIENKDLAAFTTGIEALKVYDLDKEYNFKEMDNRITMWTTNKNLVLSAALSFYEKTGDEKNYRQSANLYVEKIWNDADELNNFAWNIYQNGAPDDTQKTKTGIKCSMRSIALNNNYANNDTYAWLLYKSGDKKAALAQAHKAIAIARKTSQDYSETQKLVDLLEPTKQ